MGEEISDFRTIHFFTYYFFLSLGKITAYHFAPTILRVKQYPLEVLILNSNLNKSRYALSCQILLLIQAEALEIIE